MKQFLENIRMALLLISITVILLSFTMQGVEGIQMGLYAIWCLLMYVVVKGVEK